MSTRNCLIVLAASALLLSLATCASTGASEPWVGTGNLTSSHVPDRCHPSLGVGNPLYCPEACSGLGKEDRFNSNSGVANVHGDPLTFDKMVDSNAPGKTDPTKIDENAPMKLPDQGMEGMSFGRDPSDPTTFVYDRLIYANKRRRNRGAGDLVRGDIPIANVNAYRGWFQVSATPHLDLVKGAVGMGLLGAESTGAQYQTDVSSTGDVSVTRDRA